MKKARDNKILLARNEWVQNDRIWIGLKLPVLLPLVMSGTRLPQRQGDPYYAEPKIAPK